MNIQKPFQFIPTVRIKNNIKLLFCCLVFSINCFGSNHNVDLSRKILAIEKRSNTIIGITAIHIEKNNMVQHRGNKRFFMASTIKVPIAIAFLHRVDEKEDSLEHVIKLDSSSSVPGSGSLHYLFEKKTINMSMNRLIQYMLRNSDNSASDAVLRAAGGPVYVSNYMRSLGFKHILVNRSILETLMDTNHVDHAYLKQPRSVASWKKIFNGIPLDQKVSAWLHFERDIRDTTTPNDMAGLLVKLYKNQILSKASTTYLLGVMEKCRTGSTRIRALLPSNVKVAHKTGTWGIDEDRYRRYPGAKNLFRFASDVGIITLPKNKGHVAIAVYVKSKTTNDHMRSRAIALASREIYNYYMAQ